MEKNQRKMERDLQKALAIEFVKTYCLENNLSLEKLRIQKFILKTEYTKEFLGVN